MECPVALEISHKECVHNLFYRFRILQATTVPCQLVNLCKTCPCLIIILCLGYWTPIPCIRLVSFDWCACDRQEHLRQQVWRWELQAEALWLWLAVHGECWQKHQWLPILHHHQEDGVVGWQTCCVWQSPGGNGGWSHWPITTRLKKKLFAFCNPYPQIIFISVFILLKPSWN